MECDDPLVMYIVLRKDLLTALHWPLGAVAVQAAHAATKCVADFAPDPMVQRYLSAANRDAMRKVMCSADSSEELLRIGDNLRQSGVDFSLWVEQPEGIATCLATKPAPKSALKSVRTLRQLPLFR